MNEPRWCCARHRPPFWRRVAAEMRADLWWLAVYLTACGGSAAIAVLLWGHP